METQNGAGGAPFAGGVDPRQHVMFDPSGIQAQGAAAKVEADKKVAEAAAEAARKAAENAEIDRKYREVIAKLTPAEQAWEKTLQDHLGSFYLPLHKRDKIAGRSNAWDFVQDDPKLPRVLLIGDSVSRGYTQAAR